MKKLLVLVLLVGAGFTAYGYLGFRTTEFVPEVSTVPLNRGDVVDTVGATGTLEAVTTVQVGSLRMVRPQITPTVQLGSLRMVRPQIHPMGRSQIPLVR